MTVSAIVPARNEEATIAAAVESLAAQPEIMEIFVINDQSTDGTAAQLALLSAKYTQLHVLETQERPRRLAGGCCLPMRMEYTCRARRRERWRMPQTLTRVWSRIRRNRKRAPG